MKTDMTYCFGNPKIKAERCVVCERFITEVPKNVTLSVVETDDVPCELFKSIY